MQPLPGLVPRIESDHTLKTITTGSIRANRCCCLAGGSVGLNLDNYSETKFNLKWINLADGLWGNETAISGGETVIISAPTDNGGWVAAIVSTPKRGDLNRDNQVNIQDVQAMVNHILGLEDFGEAADVNKNGEVDILDLQNIVIIILN